MSRPIIVRPAAQNDISESFEFYQQVRNGLGHAFLDRVQEILERIELMPELYGVVWQDIRAGRLKQFRHVVYYVVFDDRTEVLAVMHGSRDVSRWRSRLAKPT